MLTMQYCMDLPPDLRANIDYVFILRENIIQNQEKIFVLGAGSNILITDKQFNGVVIKLSNNFNNISFGRDSFWGYMAVFFR